MTNKTFIDLIKARASELGLTQVALAKKMKVKQPRVSRWFGEQPPHTVRLLNNLAKAVDAEFKITLVPKNKK